MYINSFQGRFLDSCAYMFQRQPNTRHLQQSVVEDDFFEAGAESAILMPTGRKHKLYLS